MQRAKLFLEIDSGSWRDIDEALRVVTDGVILGPEEVACVGDPADPFPGLWIFRNHRAQELPSGVATEQAILSWDTVLDQCAAARDESPQLQHVPRAEVYRPQARFEFRTDYHYEGFKTYMPDLTTYRSSRVVGTDEPLSDWLQRAEELGFGTVWLHGRDASAEGRGFDLDMLERARQSFKGLFWVSGGATTEGHLRSLQNEGGAATLVLPVVTARGIGAHALSSSLRPKLRVDSVTPAAQTGCSDPSGCA